MATRAQQGHEPFANGAGRAGEEDSHAMTLTRPMVLVLVAGLTQPLVAQQRHTITHEDVFLMKRLSSPALSPDGRWVVFSVTEPSYTEGDQVTDLWLVPADGSAEPRRLTNTKGGESGVDWSPDNRRIAFSARREGDDASQIYVLDLTDGGEAQRITNLSTGASNPQWRPDRLGEPRRDRGAQGAQVQRARLRRVTDPVMGSLARRAAATPVRPIAGAHLVRARPAPPPRPP